MRLISIFLQNQSRKNQKKTKPKKKRTKNKKSFGTLGKLTLNFQESRNIGVFGSFVFFGFGFFGFFGLGVFGFFGFGFFFLNWLLRISKWTSLG